MDPRRRSGSTWSPQIRSIRSPEGWRLSGSLPSRSLRRRSGLDLHLRLPKQLLGSWGGCPVFSLIKTLVPGDRGCPAMVRTPVFRVRREQSGRRAEESASRVSSWSARKMRVGERGPITPSALTSSTAADLVAPLCPAPTPQERWQLSVLPRYAPASGPTPSQVLPPAASAPPESTQLLDP